jgi:hypothetical protein
MFLLFGVLRLTTRLEMKFWWWKEKANVISHAILPFGILIFNLGGGQGDGRGEFFSVLLKNFPAQIRREILGGTSKIKYFDEFELLSFPGLSCF